MILEAAGNFFVDRFISQSHGQVSLCLHGHAIFLFSIDKTPSFPGPFLRWSPSFQKLLECVALNPLWNIILKSTEPTKLWLQSCPSWMECHQVIFVMIAWEGWRHAHWLQPCSAAYPTDKTGSHTVIPGRPLKRCAAFCPFQPGFTFQIYCRLPQAGHTSTDTFLLLHGIDEGSMLWSQQPYEFLHWCWKTSVNNHRILPVRLHEPWKNMSVPAFEADPLYRDVYIVPVELSFSHPKFNHVRVRPTSFSNQRKECHFRVLITSLFGNWLICSGYTPGRGVFLRSLCCVSCHVKKGNSGGSTEFIAFLHAFGALSFSSFSHTQASVVE